MSKFMTKRRCPHKKRRSKTYRTFLCPDCGHIFSTRRFPKICNKCGTGKLVQIDQFKSKPRRLSRKKPLIKP